MGRVTGLGAAVHQVETWCSTDKVPPGLERTIANRRGRRWSCACYRTRADDGPPLRRSRRPGEFSEPSIKRYRRRGVWWVVFQEIGLEKVEIDGEAGGGTGAADGAAEVGRDDGETAVFH